MNHDVRQVAILVACHNRREATLHCLESIYSQTEIENVTVKTFLVDDGSTDGTSAAVKSRWPSVRIIRGNGHLYWNGAMRLAFSEAMAERFQFYLWLNDDLVLYPDAFKILLCTHDETKHRSMHPSIIVGCLCDTKGQKMTYGGWIRSKTPPHFRMQKIAPGTTPVLCDSMNGNCVLISADAAAIVGNLDSEFTHSMGDLDYGLRASGRGCRIWMTSRYVGTADLNDHRGYWTDRSLGARERWRRLRGPKGLPIKEWHVFTRRHGGRIWFLYWFSPYVRFWITELRERLASIASLHARGN